MALFDDESHRSATMAFILWYSEDCFESLSLLRFFYSLAFTSYFSSKLLGYDFLPISTEFDRFFEDFLIVAGSVASYIFKSLAKFVLH